MNTFCISGLLFLLVAHPLAAQTQGDALSRETFFDLGVTLLGDNRAQDAANVADTLIATRSDDASALILRAEAAIVLGDFSGATRFAARAYRHATSNAQKFGAAHLVALAHAKLKQDTRAQLWLRRARQVVPDQKTANAIAKDYQFLRRRNPWASTLRLGLAPSSNINNGSARQSSQLLGLPIEFNLDGEARALSGSQISGGFDVEYRINATRTSASFATFSADYRTYFLSKSAQKQAPDAAGSDFADAQLSFGVTHKQILTEGGEPTDFTVKAGQVWYGGDPYSRYIEARIGHTWALGDKDNLSLSVSRQARLTSLDNDPVLSQIDGLSIRWFHMLSNRDRFSLGASLNNSTSDDIDSTYDSMSYSFTYDPFEPVFGMRLGFGVDTETRNFASFGLAGGAPREDKSIGLNMSVNFSKVEYYGFQPVINFSARRNDSTLDLFDRDYASVGFDLRSSF